MKKEIRFNDLLSILKEELGRGCDSNNIGECYNYFVKNADSMFENDFNYSNYAESYEADSSCIIQCNKAAAYMYLNEKSKEGFKLDVEISTEEDTYFGDIEKYISESNTLILTATLDVYNEIKILQKVAQNTRSEISFVLEDSSNPDFTLECQIHFDGTLESKGRFDIRTEDRSELFYTALRLMEHFQHSKDTDLEDLNIKIYIETKYNFEEHTVTGVNIINEYFSGMREDLFTDRKVFLETLKKYPIIMDIAPMSFWEDREIVLNFVKANIDYVNRVESAFKQSEGDLNKIHSTLGVRLLHLEEYKNALINRCPKELNRWIEDKEIFSLVIESPMLYDFRFINNNYNEKIIIEWLNKHPKLIGIVYLYWVDEFANDEKETEHIKRKYRLNDKIENDILAGYKAYDIVSRFDSVVTYLKYLSANHESSIVIKDIWHKLDNESKDNLIKYSLPLIDLVKNDIDIDDPIIDYVINFCPEPGAFLSDEVIITRGLKPYERDKDELCLGCRKCDFLKARLR